MKTLKPTRFTPVVLLLTVIMLMFFSCSNKNPYHLPTGYNDFSDSAKIGWLLENYDPETVARLLCDQAAGIDSALNIKDFNEAVIIAYSTLDDTQKTSFGTTINEYASSLPVASKMKIYYQASRGNGRRLGYALAEDYLSANPSEALQLIKKDAEVLAEICTGDPEFVKDFQQGASSAFRIKGLNPDF